MPISSIQGGGAKKVDAAAELDKLLSSFDYRNLSPEDKTALVNEILKGVGGGVGAVIGSAAGPVGTVTGAGLGTLLGDRLARIIEDYRGVNPTTTTDDLNRMQWAFVEGAGPEGMGRVAPMVAPAAKNLLRKPFQPDDATRKLAALADKYGIPLNIAQRSGKESVFRIQEGIARLPFAAGTLTDAYRKQYKEWVRAMNEILDGVHKGHVSEEEFSELAEGAVRTLRDRFNAEIEGSVAAAADTIHPSPVSAEQAGTALQEGLRSNFSALMDWSDNAYGQFRGQYGGTEVDIGDLTVRLNDLIDKNVIPGSMSGKVRSGVARLQTDDAVAMADKIARSQGAGSFDSLTGRDRENVLNILRGIGIDADNASRSLTVNQLLDLRTNLLETARGYSHQAHASDKMAVHDLIDEVNDALESGLSGTDGYEELLKLNSTYRKKMEALRPPKVAGKPGNPTAGAIFNATRPETLPQNIGKSPTAIREATLATSPKTTADIGRVSAPEPMDQVRRSVFDDAVGKSKVTDESTGLRRISPPAFRQQVESLPPSLRIPSGVGSQNNIDRARLLYGNPFAQSATNRSGVSGTMNAAFPPSDPRRAGETLGLFHASGGGTAPARRAFGDYLIDKSVGRSKELPDSVRFIDPRQIASKLDPKKYGATVPRVLGEKTAQDLSDMTNLGLSVTRQEVFNPSGTAKAMEALHAVGRWGSGLYGLGTGDVAGAASIAGATYAMPEVAAKILTSPTVAKTLTAAPEAVRHGGPGWGAMGRAVAQAFPPPPQVSAPGTTSASNGDELFAEDDGDSLFIQ